MLLTYPHVKFCCRQLPAMSYIMISVLLILISAACDGGREHMKSDQLSSDEEEAIYSLVGQPCAEGDYATAIARADSLLVLPPPRCAF